MMKSKWFGLLVALLAAFGLIFVGACSNGSSGSGEEGGKTPGGNSDLLFNLADWLKDNSAIGTPFVKAGGPTIAFNADSIAFTGRENDWDAIDITLEDIGAAGETIEVRVEGAAPDGTKMKVAYVDSPYSTFQSTNAAEGKYSITASVPASYDQPRIRIQTEEAGSVEFTITKIEIEKK